MPGTEVHKSFLAQRYPFCCWAGPVCCQGQQYTGPAWARLSACQQCHVRHACIIHTHVDLMLRYRVATGVQYVTRLSTAACCLLTFELDITLPSISEPAGSCSCGPLATITCTHSCTLSAPALLFTHGLTTQTSERTLLFAYTAERAVARLAYPPTSAYAGGEGTELWGAASSS